jgi:hypothetical protein
MGSGKMTLTAVLFAVIPFLAVGCGGKPPVDPAIQRQKNELTEIHQVYLMFLKTNQRPPKQPSDLYKREYEGISPAGVRALKKGQYVVVGGVDINKDTGAVIAYEKDAPAKGGAVLLADGTVKNMSADEVKAALKKG